MRILAALLLAFASAASAQGGDEEQAKSLYRSGERAFAAGQFPVAIRAFDAAYELRPHPAILYSRAEARRLQYYAESQPEDLRVAVALFQQYLAEVPQGGRRTEVVVVLAELVPMLSRLASVDAMEKKARTELLVTSAIEGASAAIDGGPPRPLPLHVEVAPGKHSVDVSAPGHQPVSLSAQAIEGRLVAIEAELVARPSSLVVRAEPAATVFVDGRELGPSGDALSLPPGKHRVALRRGGYHLREEAIELRSEETHRLELELEPTPQRILARTSLIAAGGTGVATVVLAILSGTANGRAASLEERRTGGGGLTALEALDLDAAIVARDGRRTAAIATGVATVALGVGAAMLYLLDDAPLPRVN